MEDGSSIPGAAWKGTPRECRQSPGGHLLQNPDLSRDCTEMDTYPEALGGSDSIHPVIRPPASVRQPHGDWWVSGQSFGRT